jgi:hypothetical protein
MKDKRVNQNKQAITFLNKIFFFLSLNHPTIIAHASGKKSCKSNRFAIRTLAPSFSAFSSAAFCSTA